MAGKWLVAAGALLVVVSVLAGCSDGEGAAGGSFGPAPDRAKTPALEEALSLAGPETLGLEFLSDRRSAERLDLLGDRFDTAAAQVAHFETGLADVPASDMAALGQLSGYMGAMVEGGAPFSQADVRWTMSMYAGPSSLEIDAVLVHRLVDGVDIDAVASDLVKAGFEATDLDEGWVRFVMDGTLSERVDVLGGNVLAGRYPAEFFPEVRLHPERSLLVVGEGKGAEILDLDGGDLTPQALGLTPENGLNDIEYFSLTHGGMLNCTRAVDIATHNRSTTERVREWWTRYDVSSLGRPVASSLRWVPGDPLVLTQAFRDPATARRAYAGRQRLYRGSASRSPDVLGVVIPAKSDTSSPYEPGWSMTLKGQDIVVEHNRSAPEDAIAQHRERGVGFDACDPAADYLPQTPRSSA